MDTPGPGGLSCAAGLLHLEPDRSRGTLKEVQQLARHSDPRMTMNTYAKARPERLSALTEAICAAILPSPKHITRPQGKQSA
jgi:hypothetical protein